MALTPEQIYNLHKSYADQFSAMAMSGLQAAYAALSDSSVYTYNPPHLQITAPNFGTPKGVSNLPPLPIMQNIPAPPPMWAVREPANPDYGAAPEKGYEKQPTFELTAKPQQGVPVWNVEAPDIDYDVQIPYAPTYLTMPSMTLLPINIPSPPKLDVPNFVGTRPPDINPVDPNMIVNRYLQEQQSHRAMLTSFVTNNVDTFLARYAPEYAALRVRINNQLLAYTDPVNGGGAGVPATIESAIYARATTRINAEYQSAVEAASDLMAKRGWTIPGGATIGAMDEARLKMGDAMVGSATDIAVKNVELEQKQFQFMYTNAKDIETKMLEVISSWMKIALEIDAQAIESAKQIVAAYLGAYNVQVMVYKAMWDGYQAEASVYKSRIDALMAQASLYKAQVEGEMAKATANKAQADVISAIANANQSIAMAYKTTIEAQMAPLEVEKLRLQEYEARGKVFISEVQAWEAAYRGYVAEIEGETAKQKAWAEQINAYKTEVDAWKAKVDAYGSQIQATSEYNKAHTAQLEAQVRIWTTQADQQIKLYDSLLTGYKYGSDVQIKQAEIEIEYWKAQSGLIMNQWSVSLQQTTEFAREQMNLFRGQMEAAINAGNGLANTAGISGHMAGAAMTGLTSFAGNLVSG